MQNLDITKNRYNKTTLKNEIKKERDMGERKFVSTLKTFSHLLKTLQTKSTKSFTQNSVGLWFVMTLCRAPILQRWAVR
jgi:hypothetical protein